tara:strand:+ start:20446 stop:21276 length:831 start_codon:yes stop_codon:yes gene_type:complete
VPAFVTTLVPAFVLTLALECANQRKQPTLSRGAARWYHGRYTGIRFAAIRFARIRFVRIVPAFEVLQLCFDSQRELLDRFACSRQEWWSEISIDAAERHRQLHAIPSLAENDSATWDQDHGRDWCPGFLTQHGNPAMDVTTRALGTIHSQGCRMAKSNMSDQSLQCRHATFLAAAPAGTSAAANRNNTAHAQGGHHHVAVFGTGNHRAATSFGTHDGGQLVGVQDGIHMDVARTLDGRSGVVVRSKATRHSQRHHKAADDPAANFGQQTFHRGTLK